MKTLTFNKQLVDKLLSAPDVQYFNPRQGVDESKTFCSVKKCVTFA